MTKPGTVLATIGETQRIVFDGIDPRGMALAHVEEGEQRYATQYLGSITARLGAYMKMTPAGREFHEPTPKSTKPAT